MLFSAPSFLFLFLPAVMGIYALIPAAYRRYAILLFNLAYYVIAAWYEPIDILLVLLTAAFTYSAGFLVAVTHKRATLAAAVAVDVLAFVVFRVAYASPAGRDNFPLGAAIYLLAAISYLVDIYRSDAPHAKNIAELLIYLLFFPTILVGPIIRYRDFGRMLDGIDVSLANFAEGVRIFVAGFFRRIGIAAVLYFLLGRLGEVEAESPSLTVALIGLLLLCAAVWAELAGLSEMGRGLMHMLGMTCPADFPLLRPGTSPAVFSRRFFGSLGRWIEAYLIHPVLRQPALSPRTRRILATGIACLAPALWLGVPPIVWPSVLPVFLWRTVHILREDYHREPGRVALAVGRVCFGGLTGLCFAAFWALTALGRSGLTDVAALFAAPTLDIPYAAYHTLGFATYLIPAIIGLVCLALLRPAALRRTERWPRGGVLTLHTAALTVGMVAFAFVIVCFLPQFPDYATRVFRYLVF